jgi:t-SNARE complex subunit (syntaxin)
MKLSIRSVRLFVPLCLMLAAVLGGCASTGIERSAKASSSLRLVESDYRQVPVQVDDTNAALNELIRPGQTDVKKAYDRYAEQVTKLQQLGKRLDQHSDEMRTRGRDYFEEWEKQGGSFSNPEIRQLSEQRRSDLGQAYAAVTQASIGAKSDLDGFINDHKNIQTYLSNDLTPKGLASMSAVAQSAQQDGQKLKDSVQPVLGAIDAAKSEMARGGAPLPADATGR